MREQHQTEVHQRNRTKNIITDPAIIPIIFQQILKDFFTVCVLSKLAIFFHSTCEDMYSYSYILINNGKKGSLRAQIADFL